jgi:hypothetical protein
MISWATTAYQNQNTTELSLWFSPSRNYTDDFDLGYDVCYLWIDGLTISSIERGQSDSGRCLQTLDQACSSDLTYLTIQVASKLDLGPINTPTGDTSALPNRCTQIASQLTSNFPASCEPFFDKSKATGRVTGSPPSIGGPLTGSDSLLDSAICRLNDTYSLLWTQFGEPNTATWYIANWWVTPLITAWIPIVASDRPITLAAPKAALTCLRSSNVSEGSVVVPPLNDTSGTIISTANETRNGTTNTMPEPTSATSLTSTAKTLSAGAIAGIVVGVVLGLALLAALINSMMKRRRDRHQQTPTTMSAHFPEMGDTAMIGELGASAGHKGSVVSEMDSPKQRTELSTFKDPLELPAHPCR